MIECQTESRHVSICCSFVLMANGPFEGMCMSLCRTSAMCLNCIIGQAFLTTVLQGGVWSQGFTKEQSKDHDYVKHMQLFQGHFFFQFSHMYKSFE